MYRIQFKDNEVMESNNLTVLMKNARIKLFHDSGIRPICNISKTMKLHLDRIGIFVRELNTGDTLFVFKK